MTRFLAFTHSALAGFFALAAIAPAYAQSPAPSTSAPAAGTQIPVPTYGQHLIDEQAAAHPTAERLALHVVPPGRSDNTIVASNFGRIGKKADQDDYDVIAAGVTHVDLDEPKHRISIYPMLLDVAGHKIGSLGVVFPWKAGDDKETYKREAEKIRDDLRRRITNIDNLFEPWPFDARFATDTYAQQLVDQMLVKHPEVLIFAIHATPPGSDKSVILASNIGRHGKSDSDDDLGVVRTGKPLLQVKEPGDRYLNIVPLHDASGETIGALAVNLAYKQGDDKAKLEQKARDIEGEFARQIPSLARLVEAAR